MSSVAQFQYLNWQGLYEREKPFKIFFNIPPGIEDQRLTNLTFAAQAEETVQDIREDPHAFSLDCHGFKFIKHSTAMQNFQNADEVRETYFKEIENILRNNIEGAEYIEIFDWRLRTSENINEATTRKVNLSNPTEALLPAVYPHIDQTETAAKQRALRHLPKERHELLKKRFRIVNIWRPLTTVTAWPLAFCDLRTVRKGDLVATDFVTLDYVGETYYLKYSPDYRWYFFSEQAREDVALFKIFDSQTPETISGCPHASFSLDESDGLSSRQSVEVRAFVFSDIPESLDGNSRAQKEIPSFESVA